ncbi:hypothetical protein HDU67_000074 [Dinochytrium kinnereticum]|nr:hypothetical protein HDU67_000074 [Dinochytrium kinnereticum]
MSFSIIDAIEGKAESDPKPAIDGYDNSSRRLSNGSEISQENFKNASPTVDSSRRVSTEERPQLQISIQIQKCADTSNENMSEMKKGVDGTEFSLPEGFAEIAVVPVKDNSKGRWADYWESSMVAPLAISPIDGDAQDATSPMVKYPLSPQPKSVFGDFFSSPDLLETQNDPGTNTSAMPKTSEEYPSGAVNSHRIGRSEPQRLPIEAKSYLIRNSLALSQPTKSSSLSRSWTVNSDDNSPAGSAPNVPESLTTFTEGSAEQPPNALYSTSDATQEFAWEKTNIDDLQLARHSIGVSANLSDTQKLKSADCSPYNSLEDLPVNFKETETTLKRVVLKLRENWHVLPLFNDLLGCKFQTNQLLKSMTGENARRCLTRAVVSLINQASVILKAPVCILLDDMQVRFHYLGII